MAREVPAYIQGLMQQAANRPVVMPTSPPRHSSFFAKARAKAAHSEKIPLEIG
jgi:hypothetical protein